MAFQDSDKLHCFDCKIVRAGRISPPHSLTCEVGKDLTTVFFVYNRCRAGDSRRSMLCAERHRTQSLGGLVVAQNQVSGLAGVLQFQPDVLPSQGGNSKRGSEAMACVTPAAYGEVRWGGSVRLAVRSSVRDRCILTWCCCRNSSGHIAVSDGPG